MQFTRKPGGALALNVGQALACQISRAQLGRGAGRRRQAKASAPLGSEPGNQEAGQAEAPILRGRASARLCWQAEAPAPLGSEAGNQKTSGRASLGWPARGPAAGEGARPTCPANSRASRGFEGLEYSAEPQPRLLTRAAPIGATTLRVVEATKRPRRRFGN
jgi:hypothetical protein